MKAAAISRVLAFSVQRILRHGDGVQIDDAIEAFVALLQLDEFDDGAEIVAKMQIAGGLHAGKDALGEVRHVMRRLRGQVGGSYGNARARRASAHVPAHARAHKIKRLKSRFLARSPMCFST